MLREILEAFEDRPEIKPATMDDIVSKSSHNYSGEPLATANVEKVVPPEFVTLYDRHKDKFYLAQIAKAIAEDLGGDFSQEQLQNIQSWVYLLGSSRTAKKEGQERVASDEFKKQIEAEYVGKSLSIKVKQDSVLGDASEFKKYRVMKLEDGRIALLPPHSQRKGLLLSSPYLIILGIEA